MSTLLIGSTVQAMDVKHTDLDKEFLKAARTAARTGDLSELTLLINRGANVNYNPTTTALYTAALAPNLEVIKLLIENGANINLRNNDREGNFPLLGAARRGTLDVCKLLLRLGADVNQRDNFGHTALEEAISRGKIDVCKLLIDETLKTPIDPTRLTGINLTPEQKTQVIALRKSLEQAKGSQHLSRDTKTLVSQSLSDMYKTKNMVRRQIEEIRQDPQDQIRIELLKYLDKK